MIRYLCSLPFWAVAVVNIFLAAVIAFLALLPVSFFIGIALVGQILARWVCPQKELP